jgi:hypothetical protein
VFLLGLALMSVSQEDVLEVEFYIMEYLRYPSRV